MSWAEFCQFLLQGGPQVAEQILSRLSPRELANFARTNRTATLLVEEYEGHQMAMLTEYLRRLQQNLRSGHDEL